jgi:hypothetical protein
VDGGGGIVIVGAAAEAASSGVGTVTGTPQYGHFTRFPADSSRALKRLPQDGQPNVMGIHGLRRICANCAEKKEMNIHFRVGHGKRESPKDKPSGQKNFNFGKTS